MENPLTTFFKESPAYLTPSIPQLYKNSDEAFSDPNTKHKFSYMYLNVG